MKKEISFEKNYLTVADIKSYLCISTTAAYELPRSYFWPGWKSTLAFRQIWRLCKRR